MDQQNGQVVVVDGDVTKEMDKLFESIKRKPPQKTSSWDNKKLPKSFFEMPAHSRESSTDSTPIQPPNIIQHVRQRSAPAMLGHNLTLPAPILHPRQNSANILDDNWEGKGQHNTFLTDNNPIDSNLNHVWLQQNRQNEVNLNINDCHGNKDKLQKQIAACVLPQLPMGWEQSITAQGEVYFINHLKKETNWYDPRLPASIQKTGMSESYLKELHKHFIESQQKALQAGYQLQSQIKRITELRQQYRKKDEELAREQERLMQQLNISEQSNSPESNIFAPHVRQNSGDSGVGSNGGIHTYSLPKHPLQTNNNNNNNITAINNNNNQSNITDMDTKQMMEMADLQNQNEIISMDDDDFIPELLNIGMDDPDKPTWL